MSPATASRLSRLVRRTLVPVAFALLLPSQTFALTAPFPVEQAAQPQGPADSAALQVVGLSAEAEAGDLSGPISTSSEGDVGFVQFGAPAVGASAAGEAGGHDGPSSASGGAGFVQFAVPVSNGRPLPADFQPTAPYYGTFYYSWFKSGAFDGHWGTWNSDANEPPDTWFSHYLPNPNPAAFDPWNELYSSGDPAAIYWHLRKMAEARIEFAISSWWGPGKLTDQNFRLIATDLMNRADNPYPNLRWTLYYEEESTGDPTVEKIVADLNYIADNYAGQRAFFRIGGKPVIFVYATGGDKEGMVQRWMTARSQAKIPFYIVLKLFSGYKTVTPQPDSWHQYGPSSRLHYHAPFTASVSPGFWHDGDAAPTLVRDPAAFRDAVQQMVGADATWKLVTTWNEWGEGTGVEPAQQVRTNAATGKDEADPAGVPFGNVYVDTLHELLPPLEAGTGASAAPAAPAVPAALAAPAASAAPAAPAGFSFAAAGDFGYSTAAGNSFDAMAYSALDFSLVVGDLSYSSSRPESQWCDFVKARVGADFPVEVLVGNHEDRPSGDDGFIDAYAACLPDRLGATGLYAHQYYFDYPVASPLARVIMIDADNYRGDARADYCRDGDTANCDWLTARIDEAKAKGLWTIVATHKNCFTMGVKPCEIGAELVSVLAEKKVDLVIQGHDHGYQRSKQIALGGGCPALAAGTYNAACVADDGRDDHYTRGAGTVWVISGAGGVGSNPMENSDPDAGYVATWMDKSTSSSGWMKFTVTPERIAAQWVGSRGYFADAFSIAPAGAPACAALPTAGGVATVQVNVSQPGAYRLWSRMAAASATDTSYWVQVDDNCPVEVQATAGAGAWQWVNAAGGTLQLNGGEHTVSVGSNHKGVKLDKLLVTAGPECTPVSVTGSECVREGGPYDGGPVPPAVEPPACDPELCVFLPAVSDR